MPSRAATVKTFHCWTFFCPRDSVVHYQIAWAHDALGKEAHAAPAYEKAISLGLSPAPEE
jgi:hypothetical protein